MVGENIIMKLLINGKEYVVVIEKKIGTKNTYIRVKNDLKIYITANTFTSNKDIEKTITNNQEAIVRMINKMETRKKNSEGFLYLGKKYDVIYTSNEGINLGEEKVFVNRDADLDKWYRKKAEEVFQERFDECYKAFSKKIPYPSLTIRKMTTRWGVCNTKSKRVTLNLELIKRPIFCLDYVIFHELSHLIHANHSKEFWALVEENYPEYKKAKRILKE